MTAHDPRVRNALAHLLIARPDVVAVQRPDGAYNPLSTPWTAQKLDAHLSGTETYGHYVINSDQAKFFCFDIDFKTQARYWPENSPLRNPRKAWQDSSGADPYLRWQLRTMADLFTYRISRLGIRSMATFSGSKGLHVYGFVNPGKLSSAAELRKIGHNVMDDMGYFFSDTAGTGINYSGNNADPTIGMFDVELFPKQDTVEQGGFGNLVRMEMGINKKSMQEGFIVNTQADLYYLEPVLDPLAVLEKILTGGSGS